MVAVTGLRSPSADLDAARLPRPLSLARDRLAAANAVLEFLHLPQLDQDQLPPVRYRQQADRLTETYVDLVRSAMSSAG
jgi:hypothetical protein